MKIFYALLLEPLFWNKIVYIKFKVHVFIILYFQKQNVNIPYW